MTRRIESFNASKSTNTIGPIVHLREGKRFKRVDPTLTDLRQAIRQSKIVIDFLSVL